MRPASDELTIELQAEPSCAGARAGQRPARLRVTRGRHLGVATVTGSMRPSRCEPRS